MMKLEKNLRNGSDDIGIVVSLGWRGIHRKGSEMGRRFRGF